MKKNTLYIGYSQGNWSHGRSVSEHLQRRGYTVFFNTSEYAPLQLRAQINKSTHFILVLTIHSLETLRNSKDLVVKEINWAYENGCDIIPIIFDGLNYRAFYAQLNGKLKHLSLLQHYQPIEIVSGKDFDLGMDYLTTRIGGTNKTMPDVHHNGNGSNGHQNGNGYYHGDSTLYDETTPYSTMPQQVFSTQPFTKEQYYEFGMSAFKAKQYAHAVDQFSNALQQDRQYTIAYCMRGFSLFRMGNTGAAIRDLNRSLEIDPHFIEAYINRAIIFRHIKEYHYSLHDLDKAVTIIIRDGAKPSATIRATILHHRGMTYEGLNQPQAALTDYQNALAIELNSDTRAWLKHQINRLYHQLQFNNDDVQSDLPPPPPTTIPGW